MSSSPDTYKTARNRALRLLAAREYSRFQLQQKLYSSDAEIDLNLILDELEQEGYLSEQRFTESFIRMRIGRGQGLVRIRFELQQKGIKPDMIDACLDAMNIDSYELATALYLSKYGANTTALGLKEKAKRARFMSQRGFSSEEIKQVLDS